MSKRDGANPSLDHSDRTLRMELLDASIVLLEDVLGKPSLVHDRNWRERLQELQAAHNTLKRRGIHTAGGKP
jgi:hypothetical protein